MRNLQLYSIMPLDVNHVDEVCADIREQYESGVSSCALFCMTLVPEGNPVVNKAAELCRKYDIFREKLDAMGVPSGVLVQASIGHGWVLGERPPFQAYVNFTDGQKTFTTCPLDPGFRAYIRDAMHTIAAHKPACIMVDDDFRLMGRSGQGCACPLHLKRYARLAGHELSRERLWDLATSDTEEGRRAADLFVQTQHDSVIETAKIMREGIDEVDPSLPGSFCCVGNNAEFAAEIAHILAGKGNPVVVRINNGHYCQPTSLGFSAAFYRAAEQIAKLRSEADVILAETDTCPQNRYSTGAMPLHTHFTGSILEGAQGAKHWITRLHAYEPESGRMYRRILSRYRGFYQALADITPSLRWHGCRIPVHKEAHYSFGGSPFPQSDALCWSTCVLERLGLPVYFSPEDGGVLCLAGRADKALTDEQILKALHGPVFLASDAAEQLIARGFGRYLGVDVRPWTGKQPSREWLTAVNNECGCQQQLREIVPLSEATQVDSMVEHTVDQVHYEPLFPGVTVFENELGGTAFVFAGTPKAEFSIVSAFSFLNWSRKQQLIHLLKRTGEMPFWYPGDENVYFRTADRPDGSCLCAIFNLSFDPIEHLTLASVRQVTSLARLTADGRWEDIPFRQDGELITLDIPCMQLDPVIILAR